MARLTFETDLKVYAKAFQVGTGTENQRAHSGGRPFNASFRISARGDCQTKFGDLSDTYAMAPFQAIWCQLEVANTFYRECFMWIFGCPGQEGFACPVQANCFWQGVEGSEESIEKVAGGWIACAM